MPRYRKRPIEIEADQWDGRPHPLVCTKPECGAWAPSPAGHDRDKSMPHIHTLEGSMVLSKGDYIVTGIRGEHYPVRRDIFEDTYEEM